MAENPIIPDAIVRGEYDEYVMAKWFASASARQLEAYIREKKPHTRGRIQLEVVKATESIERAQIALNIRLAEDAAEFTSKIIQHTDTLTKQTEMQIEYAKILTAQTATLINESKALNHQTNELVKESQGLARLTWGLIWLTVVLAVLTAGLFYIDWHREHEPTPIHNETTH